ncbi:MAG TPA: class II aldolase/adducin family protein [Acidobacteriaceae bacterium]|nr:class II aldolase/adducin family protein [Acidobacteriaceae bacterium]
MTLQPAITVLESPSPARNAAHTGSPVVNIEQSERELRRQLARCAHWMHRLGFAPGTSGNLSVRLSSGDRFNERRLLATPTGCSKALLRPSDMVIVDLEGRQHSGTRNVTSEIGMHLAVYRARPDVNAVVHAHPPIATAFASCGLALDAPLCAEIVMTLGKIPLAPYATTGTDEVASSLQPFLRDHDAVLLANHGLVTYGKDLLDAFMKTEVCEHFAQVCLTTRQLGCAKPLEPEALNKLAVARTRYLANLRPSFRDQS